jgi:hypothetical protein
MNAGMRWVIAISIGVVLAVAGCGKSGPTKIAIKGLSLGMDITTAQTTCSQLLEDSGCTVGEIQDGELAVYDMGSEDGRFFGFTALGMNLAGGGVTADKNGKVNGIIFSGGLVGHIFNATDMEDSDFVQKFADSYRIPEFKVADNNEFWYFDSPSGFRVIIKPGKGLTLKTIAGANKQNFN